MNPFRQALEGWSEEKWSHGQGRGPGGSVCILLRLKDVGGYADAVMHVDRVAAEMFPDRTETIHGLYWAERFNDHPDTTWSDVVQVLEKAAVRWDEEVR